MGEFAQMGVWLDMARPAKQAVDTQETAAAKVKKAYQILNLFLRCWKLGRTPNYCKYPTSHFWQIDTNTVLLHK